MGNSRLVVELSYGRLGFIGERREFDDWFDFADFIKQQNLAGTCVNIHHWEYQRAGVRNNGWTSTD